VIRVCEDRDFDAICAIINKAAEKYEKRGFKLVPAEDKDHLLQKYWSIPGRQVETSVVLADPTWFALRDASRG
jgi:hypothetical protein